MKFFRTAVILAAILVVGGGSYWFFEVKRKKDMSAKKEKEALLFAKSDKKVAKLVLRERGKDPIVVQLKTPTQAKKADEGAAQPEMREGKGEDAEESAQEAKGRRKRRKAKEREEAAQSAGDEEDEWLIVSPVRTGGDSVSIRSIIDSLKNAKREAVIRDSLEREAEYGLPDPDFSIEFAYEGETESQGISFGVGTLDRKRHFAKLLGRNEIITVPSSLQGALNKTLFDLRDKRIAPIKNEDIVQVTKVSLVGTPESFVLGQEGEEWYFKPDRTDPEKVKALESRVNLYTGYLRWGNFAEVVQEKGDLKSYPKYGLDKPILLVTFRLKDGGTYLFMVGKSVQEGNAEFFYATRSTDTMVFQVKQDTVKNLAMTKFQIKDRHIFGVDAKDIVKASFKYGDQDFTVVKEGEEWKFEGAKEHLTKGYSIENTIFALATAEYEDVPPVRKGDPAYAKTGLDNPKYTVTMHFNDNREPLVLKIGEKDQESKAWMTPDDGKTAYKIFAYFASNLPDRKEELMK